MPRKKHIQLSIPTPCQQAWSEMRPEGNGRFCESCQTKVIDFTQMGDAEVAGIMAGKNAPHCGRFRDAQLGRAIEVTYHRVLPYWPRLAAGAILVMLAMPHAVLAQAPSRPFEYTWTNPSASATPSEPFLPPTEDSIFVLKGFVIDNEFGEPSIGQRLSIGSELRFGTNTSDSGYFEIRIPFADLRDTLALNVYGSGMAIPIAIPRDQQFLEITLAVATPVQMTVGYVIDVRDQIRPTPVRKMRKREVK